MTPAWLKFARVHATVLWHCSHVFGYPTVAWLGWVVCWYSVWWHAEHAVELAAGAPAEHAVTLSVGTSAYAVSVVSVTPLAGLDRSVDEIPAPIQAATDRDLDARPKAAARCSKKRARPGLWPIRQCAG